MVVGAGSGGFAAARTARDLKASVALVDPGPLAGLCILRGCMPSKTYLASSDRAYEARHGEALGVRADAVSVDMPAVQARKKALVQDWAQYRIEGIQEFPLFSGKAEFLNDRQLRVGDDTLEAGKFIVATGSVVAPPPLAGLSEAGYIDSDAVLELETLPESVVVLGGGYTACELGQFLARMGVRTEIVIRSGHLLTDSDDDIGDSLTAAFRNEGIEVHERTTISRVSVRDGKKIVHIVKNGVEAELCAQEIFYAMGRVPNVEGLNLEAAGVQYHAVKGVDVDRSLRTSNPAIFAVGDVTGTYALVHVAIYQGEIAARNAITGGNEHADYTIVSAHTVFTEPQIGIVGATEKQLKHDGIDYVIGRYDFAEHGKSVALNRTDGFVKMMADPKTGRILGGAVIGPQGSELIHEVIVAMSFESTVQQFMRIPHLHPTLAEIWTYPAEECADQIGKLRPGELDPEVAGAASG